MALDCSLLGANKDFADYIIQLESLTRGNITQIQACKPQICSALWGTGNSDISGIGVNTLGSEGA